VTPTWNDDVKKDAAPCGWKDGEGPHQPTWRDGEGRWLHGFTRTTVLARVDGDNGG
jgi:hypothetical protein